MPALSYEQALLQDDKSALTKVEAPSGAIPRIVEFPNLTSLELTDNTSLRDFSFLSKLPKLQELYLAGMGLSEIPAQVTNLPELTTLFLGRNSIKDFSILRKLPKLIDLGLEEMELRKIPNEVAAIAGLKILGLYGNEITSLSTLKKLKGLEELFVANNRIKSIPKELAKLPLRKLDIMHNFPLTGYEVLGELEGLEELLLTNSREVASTPACIFELAKLKRLTLYLRFESSSAAIEGIEKIGNLQALEELTLEEAPITRLPDSISSLKRLRKLSIKKCKSLTSVDALRDLDSLEELDLSSCDVREIGEGFSTLKGLVRLKLSHNNKLENVSGLRDLPSLQFLELYSKLPSLPDSLGTLTALTELKLSAKARGIGFLSTLDNLEELYLAVCSFEALPNSLHKLKRLTVFRDESANDDYLAAYPLLEELEVSQPSFTLPTLPTLTSLRVGRIESNLDLSKIGDCLALETLSIHRSESITELPKELALARSVKRANFEFLKQVTNISALAGLVALEELELSHLKKLEALPGDLAALGKLRKLDLSDLEKVKDLSVLGELPALEWLRLDDLDGIQALPDSLAKLDNLRCLQLRNNDKLKDISVLEKVSSLEELSVEYCDELKRKSIAAVENAIASRMGSGAALQTSYQQFMESNSHEKLSGKEDAKQTYSFPLWFDTPEVLLEAVEHYSWLDDIRDDENVPENAILTDPESALKPIAILDLGWEGCDTSYIDSYCEEIFLVDTASARNPVFIWGHDGSPTKIHDDFDDFLANLRDFMIEGEGDGDEESAEDGASGQRTYLEYTDDKSAKFWQVVVTGSQHEVTYGKIGKAGSAKIKEFDSPEAAQKDADKLIASKRKKGYADSV